MKLMSMPTCTLYITAAYYDYQLSKARRKFGDEVLALKLRCRHVQLNSFPLIKISSAIDVNGRQIATGNGASNQLPVTTTRFSR